jgi:hypothetical protein
MTRHVTATLVVLSLWFPVGEHGDRCTAPQGGAAAPLTLGSGVPPLRGGEANLLVCDASHAPRQQVLISTATARRPALRYGLAGKQIPHSGVTG